MSANADECINRCILGEVVSVAEFGEDIPRLDELVEEVVVGGCVREEGLACGEGEGDQVDEGGYHVGGAVDRLNIGCIGV